MQEELSGKGTLRCQVHPVTEWPVDYRFVITTNIIRRPGFPPVAGHRDSIGTVASSNGDVIPEGYYQLIAEDGEILRVKNLGMGQWVILAPA